MSKLSLSHPIVKRDWASADFTNFAATYSYFDFHILDNAESERMNEWTMHPKSCRLKLLDTEENPGNGTRKIPHLAVKPKGNHWSLRERERERVSKVERLMLSGLLSGVPSVLCMSKAKAALPSSLPYFLPFVALSSEIVPDFSSPPEGIK